MEVAAGHLPQIEETRRRRVTRTDELRLVALDMENLQATVKVMAGHRHRRRNTTEDRVEISSKLQDCLVILAWEEQLALEWG